jgi:hypothetical protein
MQGANQDFMKNKAAWLQDNIVFYNVGHAALANPLAQTADTGGAAGELPIAAFDLRPIPSVKDAANKKYKAYAFHQMPDLTGSSKNKARKVGGFTHALNAYFLAWGSGKTYEGLLGTNADYFFTPTVNGCSFAASSNAMNPRVAHSNHANLATQLIDQGRIDADLNNIFGVAGPDLALRKADYKGPPVGTSDYLATIIGFRTATGWEFYYQRYSQDVVHKPGIGSVFENVVLNPCNQIT